MLSVSGVADAIHIAVYYIGTILLEYQERNPGSISGSYRQAGGRGPGFESSGPRPSAPGSAGPYTGAAPNAGPGAQTQQIFIPNALVGASESAFSPNRFFTLTPLLPCLVIGKGGVKINEIRAQSQCQIRVTDPGTAAQAGSAPSPDERLVTITGQPNNINMAVQMLYSVGAAS